MNKIYDFIANNPMMVSIGWLATVIALILSIIFFIVSKKKRQLTFEYDTTELVRAKVAKIQNITILFNEKPIERLSVTKFKIVNTGNTIIRSSEIYPKHELKIVGINLDIVSAELESVTRDIVSDKTEINFTNEKHNTLEQEMKLTGLRVKEDTALGIIPLQFNVFEKKDYMILNIYHNGNINAVFHLLGMGEELKIRNGNIEKAIKDNLNSTNSLSVISYFCQSIISHYAVFFDRFSDD